MTYAEIKNLFNLKLDKEVNAYFSDTEIASILNSALYRLLEDRYRAFESSNRISEHLTGLTRIVYREVAGLVPFLENNGDQWQTDTTTQNLSVLSNFTGWLYVLDLKLSLTKKAVSYGTNAVASTSTLNTEKVTHTIPARKINLDANFERDPYLRSNLGSGVSNENLDDTQLYYQLVNGGIKFQFPDFNAATLLGTAGSTEKWFNWDIVTTSAFAVLTCIAKPTEFTVTNIVTNDEYTELTESGQRDLVNYAIQITSEITREKDEYQFITGEIQKDLL